MKDWDIQINYGVKTGFNDAFIIDGQKRKKLIEQDPKSAEIIRPILRGRDIKRYSYEFADLWLINMHNGIKEKGIKPININDYPAIKKHLDKYYPELEKRQDKGDTPYNLRNCAYIEDFSKQKIVWTPVNNEYRFALVDAGYFFNNSIFMITSNGNENLKIILSVMNSILFIFYLNIITSEEYQYGSKDLFQTFPIPNPDKKFEQQIENLLQKQKYSEIDEIIYNLYGLTKEEIQFIENQ